MSKQQETFRYTSLCRFYVAGRCERGEDCRFAHDESQLRAKPNLLKTRICRSLQKTGTCKEGPGCRYAHSQDEVRDYNSGAESAEGGDAWARTESSWSQDDDEGCEAKSPYLAMPWMEGMYCPMWPGYGFQVMGWVPDASWCWEDPSTESKESKADGIPEGLEWDPIGKAEGEKPLAWDPLGLSWGPKPKHETNAERAQLEALAARSFDKMSSSDCVKRASFYSLPSTTFSEDKELKDDETDSVFEAWAATEAVDKPDDIFIHKGVHYEMSVRNTFISFGVAGTAKRMLQRSRSEPCLDDRE